MSNFHLLQGGSLICACLTLFFMASSTSNSQQQQQQSTYMASRLARDELSRVTGISVLMYLLLTLVSAMLLYGVLKAKASYILPFFGIQFIDYLFTMPQFLASLYTHPYHGYYVSKAGKAGDQVDQSGGYLSMRHVWPPTSSPSSSMASNGSGSSGGGGGGDSFHYPTYSTGISTTSGPAQLYTTTLLFMTLLLIFKTYFLCVVWKCYRYLHMQQFILPLTLAGHLTAAEVRNEMLRNSASRSSFICLKRYNSVQLTNVVFSYLIICRQ